MKPMLYLAIIGISAMIIGCANPAKQHAAHINENGKTIESRFPVPANYMRTDEPAGSFGNFLRNLNLHPEGTDVRYYDGRIKPKNVHAAVINIDIGTKDLQQCADAVMRLRAEYLYSQNKKEQIAFNFTNGFRAAYTEWMKGKRMVVKGNTTYWEQKAAPADTYESFRKYMDLIFTYAGTRSLEKEMHPVSNIHDIKTGDVFIRGGSPGHAVIVVDMAEHKSSGKKIFLLAQSYMPAQHIHVLINSENKDLSPWYSEDFGETLITPEWEFKKTELRRF